MKQTLQSMIDRFLAVRRAWARIPETAFDREQVWYAGLAVSPAGFSRQLSKLQVSLQGETVAVKLPVPSVTS